MNRTVKYLVGAATGVALMVGGAGTAFAADPTPTPVSPDGVTPYCQPVGGGRWGGAGGWGGAGSMLDDVAKFLGISDPATIAAERQAGKSLVDIASEQGKSRDDLLAAMTAERKVQLDEAVEAGRLTQAQEGLMLQQMETRMSTAVERTTVGPMGPSGIGAQQGAVAGGRGARFQSGAQTPGQPMGPGMGGRWGATAN